MKTSSSFIFGSTRADAATAHEVLKQCQFQVKVALIVLMKKQTIEQAQSLLDNANGNARAVLRA